MKKVLIVAMMVVVSGCATTRTRSSDPVMGVGIDADGISQGSYARLQNALMDSGKFVVVDRGAGYKAINKEQDRQHKGDRFQERAERYARYGAQFGAGGIVVANEQCQQKQTWLNKTYYECLLSISLVNTTTSEVMAMAEDSKDTENAATAAEYTDVVEKMIKKYPKTFIDNDHLHQTIKYDKTLQQYREENEKDSHKPASTDEE